MKQKRIVSMIGTLVVIISAVVLGCSQPNSNKGNTDNNNGNISNNGGNSGDSTGGNTGNNSGTTSNNSGNTGGNTGDNTGNGGSSTTTPGSVVYEYTEKDGGVTYRYTITFNTDGTYMQRTNEASGGSVEAVVAQGIYTGDASKDGTISMTIKKVHNGTALVDYTGANATQSIIISGGTFTLLGVKYTRQDVNNGGNSSGNGGSSTTTQERAEYMAKIENSGVTYTNTIVFETDGSYMNRVVGGSIDRVTVQGTYTGDASKDGTISMTIKKVHNGTALVDYTGLDATRTITIAGGKFIVDGGLQYTRQ